VNPIGKIQILMPGTKKCPHLRGRGKKKFCSIYEDRPLACRIHIPSEENCKWDRLAVKARKEGIKPWECGWPLPKHPPERPKTGGEMGCRVETDLRELRKIETEFAIRRHEEKEQANNP